MAVIIVVSSRASAEGDGAVTPSVYDQVTGVSAQTFAAVGNGGLRQSLTGTPANVEVWKDKAGKPVVFYVGTDYCPFCAGQRWSLIVALSRFGTWSNLSNMASMASDNPPSVPTFTFHGASYSSAYVTFIGRELRDRDQQPLDTLSSDENAVFTTYNSPPYVADQASAGGVPFVSIANQYLAHGLGYDLGILTGQTRESIAGKLNSPNDPIAQSIVGNANYLTAAICKATGDKPASVCATAPIPDLEKQLPARS